MAAVAVSRIQRFKALQDILSAAGEVQGEKQDDVTSAARVPEAALAGLAALLPDSVVQQALHIVDAGSIACVQSRRGRRMYEVRGKRFKHIVLPHGAYCSCPYFSRRVLEAGELCCKHWLAVQLATRCGAGITSSSTLGEDEFLEWSQQSFTALSGPTWC
mmetsp:Transcript_136216/g.240762  ORF Transcript_136216/g.240762 Transcript_136216/m.240762 type:complete len:160 (-) Transcript_136216:38-517(-)